MGAATVSVEAVEGAHGKYALHAHYPEATRGAYAMAVATHVPDSLSTHVFRPCIHEDYRDHSPEPQSAHHYR